MCNCLCMCVCVCVGGGGGGRGWRKLVISGVHEVAISAT